MTKSKLREIIRECLREEFAKVNLKESIGWDFSIEGFAHEITDTFEDEGYTGYEVIYSKDGRDIVKVELWEDGNYVTVIENLYAQNLMQRNYETFTQFAEDLEYKCDRYLREDADQLEKLAVVFIGNKFNKKATLDKVTEPRYTVVFSVQDFIRQYDNMKFDGIEKGNVNLYTDAEGMQELKDVLSEVPARISEPILKVTTLLEGALTESVLTATNIKKRLKESRKSMEFFEEFKLYESMWDDTTRPATKAKRTQLKEDVAARESSFDQAEIKACLERVNAAAVKYASDVEIDEFGGSIFVSLSEEDLKKALRIGSRGGYTNGSGVTMPAQLVEMASLEIARSEAGDRDICSICLELSGDCEETGESTHDYNNNDIPFIGDISIPGTPIESDEEFIEYIKTNILPKADQIAHEIIDKTWNEFGFNDYTGITDYVYNADITDLSEAVSPTYIATYNKLAKKFEPAIHAADRVWAETVIWYGMDIDYYSSAMANAFKRAANKNISAGMTNVGIDTLCATGNTMKDTIFSDFIEREAGNFDSSLGDSLYYENFVCYNDGHYDHLNTMEDSFTGNISEVECIIGIDYASGANIVWIREEDDIESLYDLLDI